MDGDKLDPRAAGAGTIRIGDMEVGRLGFGAMRITGRGIWGAPNDRNACIDVLKRAVALGVTFIDTADSYGPNVSEELIAEALHPYPQGLVIATKGGLTRHGPNDWRTDCRPEHLREACEGSLRRLKLDRIDLYQLHTVDSRVRLEESLGALVRLQEARENPAYRRFQRNRRADRPGTPGRDHRVGPEPVQYGRTRRRCDRRSLRARRYGVPPLGPSRVGASCVGSKTAGRDPAQMSLAWLLARSSAMLPIPGTSSVAHLEENMAAAKIHLDERELGPIGHA